MRRGAASVPPWPFRELGLAARLGQPGQTPPKPRTPMVATVFPQGPHARGEDLGPAFPLWQSPVPLHSAFRRGVDTHPPMTRPPLLPTSILPSGVEVNAHPPWYVASAFRECAARASDSAPAPEPALQPNTRGGGPVAKPCFLNVSQTPLPLRRLPGLRSISRNTHGL